MTQTIVFDKIYLAGQNFADVEIAVLNEQNQNVSAPITQHDVVVSIKSCCRSENGMILVANLDLTKPQDGAKIKTKSEVPL